jgi:hypothetical protein
MHMAECQGSISLQKQQVQEGSGEATRHDWGDLPTKSLRMKPRGALLPLPIHPKEIEKCL